jgi:DNA sulfur modification protein DndD
VQDVSLTYITRDGNTEKEPFPSQRIDRMLPPAIRTFFFFDGDRISDFTRPGRERDAGISKAVNDVLHIEALSRAVAHTKEISDKKKRAVVDAAPPSVAQTVSEIKLQEAALQRHSDRSDDLEAQERETLEIIASLDAQLSSVIEVARASKARMMLENKRNLLLATGRQLRQQLAKATVSAVPALTEGKLKSANQILGRYKSRHEIPARIQDHFLRELLERGECICGRSIGGSDEARNHLEKLLKSLLPDSLQDTATDLLGKLRPVLKETENLKLVVVSISKDIVANGIEVSKVDRELERVAGEIDVSAIDGAEILNRKRVAATKLLGDLKEARPRAERALDASRKTLRLLETRLKDEAAKRDSLRELNEVWATAKDCNEMLSKAKGILEARLRSSLAVEATDIMKKLASEAKAYFFSRIQVEDGFVLKVLDNEGEDVRPQLSMGETQVSSLAFMLAMTRIGGQEAPLAIDTPLARLDQSVRANAAKWLPNLTPQLILLVTDAEFEPAVRETIAPRVGASYDLIPGPAGTKIMGGVSG